MPSHFTSRTTVPLVVVQNHKTSELKRRVQNCAPSARQPIRPWCGHRTSLCCEAPSSVAPARPIWARSASDDRRDDGGYALVRDMMSRRLLSGLLIAAVAAITLQFVVVLAGRGAGTVHRDASAFATNYTVADDLAARLTGGERRDVATSSRWAKQKLALPAVAVSLVIAALARRRMVIAAPPRPHGLSWRSLHSGRAPPPFS